MSISLTDTEVTPSKSLPTVMEPGRYVRLTVTDTGIGMDAETQDKIFEPYFTTKKVEEGTGLGLAVVHGIVQSYKGYITIESSPGQGSSFSVFLPCFEGPVEPGKDEKETRSPITGSERIMFIDDEENITSLANEVFTMHGYQVTIYNNGIQALQDFVKKVDEVDLVITDMTMPYMTGAELSQKLLAIKPDLAIILCSGYSDLIDTDRAKAMGISEYVQKPINVDQLLITVRSVLDRNC